MDEVLTILAVCLLVVALSVFGYFVYSEVQDAKAAAHPVHHHKS
jgi:hypothetical protein